MKIAQIFVAETPDDIVATRGFGDLRGGLDGEGVEKEGVWEGGLEDGGEYLSARGEIDCVVVW